LALARGAALPRAAGHGNAAQASRPRLLPTRAGEALADRRFFSLNAEKWKAFMVALDASPRSLPRLERLIHEPGFFDAK